jgi:hypothetical protein
MVFVRCGGEGRARCGYIVKYIIIVAHGVRTGRELLRQPENHRRVEDVETQTHALRDAAIYRRSVSQDHRVLEKLKRCVKFIFLLFSTALERDGQGKKKKENAKRLEINSARVSHVTWHSSVPTQRAMERALCGGSSGPGQTRRRYAHAALHAWTTQKSWKHGPRLMRSSFSTNLNESHLNELIIKKKKQDKKLQ